MTVRHVIAALAAASLLIAAELVGTILLPALNEAS